MISATVTTGGLGLALVILYANLKPWWKSNDRDPRLLGPFTAGFSLGALSTLCAGGVLGVLATWTAHANNSVGGHVVPGSTGQPQSTLAHGQMGQLSPGGGLVVFILAAAVVLAWRATGKGDAGKIMRRRMAGGVLCGLTFALTVGVAGVLRPTLLALTNGSGDHIIAAFNHGIAL